MKDDPQWIEKEIAFLLSQPFKFTPPQGEPPPCPPPEDAPTESCGFFPADALEVLAMRKSIAQKKAAWIEAKFGKPPTA